MKIYTPQTLADEIGVISVDFIRRNAEAFGFKKVGNGRGRWIGCDENIKRALQCSIKDPVPEIGTLSSSTAGAPSKSPLAQRLDEMRKSTKRNSVKPSNRSVSNPVTPSQTRH